MTWEEAIRILDPETTAEALAEIEYYAGFSGKTAAVHAVSDACEISVAAMRRLAELENNNPLTLEEVRQMDGEPVWDNFLMEWCLVMMDLCGGKGAVKYFDGGFNRLSERRFYRRKPEEVPG